MENSELRQIVQGYVPQANSNQGVGPQGHWSQFAGQGPYCNCCPCCGRPRYVQGNHHSWGQDPTGLPPAMSVNQRPL